MNLDFVTEAIKLMLIIADFQGHIQSGGNKEKASVAGRLEAANIITQYASVHLMISLFPLLKCVTG